MLFFVMLKQERMNFVSIPKQFIKREMITNSFATFATQKR
jgi:hypothetical protein